MSKTIDEILDKYQQAIDDFIVVGYGNPETDKEEAKQSISDLVDEIIGEDERNPGIRKHIFAQTFQGKRNKLRKEQRARAKQRGIGDVK